MVWSINLQQGWMGLAASLVHQRTCPWAEARLAGEETHRENEGGIPLARLQLQSVVTVTVQRS
jgi:hypothetical protein